MKDELKKKYTNDLRLTILENSLFHEFLITKSLGDMLEVDIENSYSLSDKSTGLSLAAKIHLLIDLNSLTKEQKPKLFYYLEIRNQFLHNWKCKTFGDCFKSRQDTYNALKKLYKPDITLSSEQQMAQCYNALSDDIVDIAINHLTMKVINTKVSREGNKKDLEKYKEIRNNIVKMFWDSLESDTLKGYEITQEDKVKLLDDFIKKVM